MSFSNAPLDIRYRVGITAKHRCHYRLFSNQDYLGEMSFTSVKPFEDEELALLEGLLGVIIIPVKSEVHRTRQHT